MSYFIAPPEDNKNNIYDNSHTIQYDQGGIIWLLLILLHFKSPSIFFTMSFFRQRSIFNWFSVFFFFFFFYVPGLKFGKIVCDFGILFAVQTKVLDCHIVCVCLDSVYIVCCSHIILLVFFADDQISDICKMLRGFGIVTRGEGLMHQVYWLSLSWISSSPGFLPEFYLKTDLDDAHGFFCFSILPCPLISGASRERFMAGTYYSEVGIIDMCQ